MPPVAFWHAALKCTKFVFGRGSTPDPTGEAHSAPLDPVAGLRGLLLSGGDGGKGERERRRGEEWNGRDRPPAANSCIHPCICWYLLENAATGSHRIAEKMASPVANFTSNERKVKCGKCVTSHFNCHVLVNYISCRPNLVDVLLQLLSTFRRLRKARQRLPTNTTHSQGYWTTATKCMHNLSFPTKPIPETTSLPDCSAAVWQLQPKVVQTVQKHCLVQIYLDM